MIRVICGALLGSMVGWSGSGVEDGEKRGSQAFAGILAGEAADMAVAGHCTAGAGGIGIEGEMPVSSLPGQPLFN